MNMHYFEQDHTPKGGDIGCLTDGCEVSVRSSSGNGDAGSFGVAVLDATVRKAEARVSLIKVVEDSKSIPRPGKARRVGRQLKSGTVESSGL